ncbi:MAG: RagB/SusD family nutrient uptake outer membrane protein [Bacteroidales bacterium]|nr:RagB/SusD family nutrient uptake outer membrane protein [Bacteroidales bacterium]
MKQIFKISFALALVLGFSSCDMNLRPYSVIDPDNALESYADAQKLANGFNNQIRSLAVGSKIYGPELQSDLFHAVADFGNRGGDLYRWEFDASNGYPESLWASCYAAIANANFFLQKAQSVYDRVEADEDFAATWTEKQLEGLKGYESVAYFLRAYSYSFLLDRFCPAYSDATANTPELGVPIVTVYEPTSDKEKYPARSTMKETYAQILADLELAEENIEAAYTNAAGSKYVTSDAVKALRARVALACKDYEQAVEDATAVINSGTYSLVSGVDALSKLWVNDDQKSECIMQCYVALPSEKPGTNDYGYIGYNAQKDFYAPDYIPEQWLVDLYADNDYRKAVFFKQTPITLSSGTTDPLYIFYKFSGNPSLMTGPTDYNYLNAPKPFRLAELYLIAAEAYLNSGIANGVQMASDLMNELQSKRIADWKTVNYTASTLPAEIQKERVRELVGEGFRLSDLKRYGKGITRTASQNNHVISQPGGNTTEFLSKGTDDHRFVWPIPTAETDANPKCKQNNGYTK